MMQQQSALVLHVRPYRESSAIVQFMTKEQAELLVLCGVFAVPLNAAMQYNPLALARCAILGAVI